MCAPQHTPTHGKSYPCRRSPRTAPACVAQRRLLAPDASSVTSALPPPCALRVLPSRASRTDGVLFRKGHRKYD
eukprot:2883626-Pleurochrysis_carterae.AAC.2